MKWLSSFNLLVRSSITTLKEKVEDPERMLHQLIIDMEEELDHVRESVAEAIADEIQLGRQVQRGREDAGTWSLRAEKCIRGDDNSSARQAVEQKVAAKQRVETLEREYDEQKSQTAKLQKSVQNLENKIRQARQKRTLLLARMARADSTTRINRAIDRAGDRSAFAQFNRLEEKVERREAKCKAYDRLEGRDVDAEEIDEKFRDQEARERVEQELEELRSRLSDSDEDEDSPEK